MRRHTICGIYRITNNSTGECYIGQSRNMMSRWQQHLDKLIRGRHENRRLQNSYDLHADISLFSFDVLCVCDVRELDRREHDFMVKLRPALNYARPEYEKIDAGQACDGTVVCRTGKRAHKLKLIDTEGQLSCPICLVCGRKRSRGAKLCMDCSMEEYAQAYEHRDKNYRLAETMLPQFQQKYRRATFLGVSQNAS